MPMSRARFRFWIPLNSLMRKRRMQRTCTGPPTPYAQVLGEGADSIKNVIDPFTGCFVSGLPTTVVHLRFALKVATMFAAGDAETASQFVRQGARRIPKVLGFVRGQNSQLKQQYEAERAGWNLF